MDFSEIEKKAELIGGLLLAEGSVPKKLLRGELGREEAANLASRINTGVVTLFQEALEDRELAERMIKRFEKAIRKGTTVSPRVVSTLSKILAMRHDMEFNGHKASERELKTNLAALQVALDLNVIGEKQEGPKEKSSEEQGREPKKGEEDNQMFG